MEVKPINPWGKVVALGGMSGLELNRSIVEEADTSELLYLEGYGSLMVVTISCKPLRTLEGCFGF